MEVVMVAFKLMEEFITRYRFPEQLHNDEGYQFQSEVYQETTRLLGVRLSRSSSYHLYGSCQIKRCNLSQQRKVKHTCQAMHKQR